MLHSKVQEALENNTEQLELVQQQLKRLEDALWKADILLEKWSNRMGIHVVVSFVKASLDKEDTIEVSDVLEMRCGAWAGSIVSSCGRTPEICPES